MTLSVSHTLDSSPKGGACLSSVTFYFYTQKSAAERLRFFGVVQFSSGSILLSSR